MNEIGLNFLFTFIFIFTRSFENLIIQDLKWKEIKFNENLPEQIFSKESIQIKMTNISYFGSTHFWHFFGVKVVTFEKDASPKPNGFNFKCPNMAIKKPKLYVLPLALWNALTPPIFIMIWQLCGSKKPSIIFLST